MKKKKQHGHYCRICGQHKANEKFSGRGHAAHICKACHALPISKRNELAHINEIERISESFFISKEKQKRLERLAGDKRYPESSEQAREALDDFRRRMDEYHGNARDDEISEECLPPVTYSELPDPLKEAVKSGLTELITGFIAEAGYIPEEDDIEEITQIFCEEFSEGQDWELIPDDGIMSLFGGILRRAEEEIRQSQ
jgi:hypothetical protein